MGVGLEEGWIDFALGAAMFTLMFGMGLTLAAGDFRRIALNPRATIVGTVLQLLVMPVVGIALARFFELSPLLSAGIVVVAACPGGMFSNMYVHLARGHTALSITLTATATLVTLFTLPLWVQFALSTFSASDAAPVEMPVFDTALRLGTLTVLPVLIGMAVRHKWPAMALWERRLSLAAAAVIVAGATLQGTSQPDVPIEDFLASIPPALGFAFAAIAVGVIIPPLFRISARDTVTIAVELIVKNTLLGIVLVGQVLDFEAMLPIFAFAIFQTPGGLLLLGGWRLLEKRGLLATSDKSDRHEPA
jgi:BASS family bile acid:Na+ symporter